MIDLKKVQKQILNATPVLGRESVPLLEAVGRILIRDIVAVEDLPAADISAMDGYAVNHILLEGVSHQHPARFKIIGEAPAGRPFKSSTGHGEAVRIMTGGVLPRGVDTVVKLEDSVEENGYVICRKNPGYGSGIRFKGESLKKGQVVLHAGDTITPVEVGALASLRRAYVYVHRKPTVAILSTGDELSDFHEPSQPSKAMCSNIYALAAQVIDAGATPLCLGIVQDHIEDLEALLYEAVRADVIITSGGTSKGKYDLVHKAFASLGMKIRFSNIFEKPGKPTVFGNIKNSMVFGLPGNPSATMLSFEQFIKPSLMKMMGHKDPLNTSRRTNESISFIDSFNTRYGGNKNHHRAPQIPLEKGIPENHDRLSEEKSPTPGPMQNRLKMVAH